MMFDQVEIYAAAVDGALDVIVSKWAIVL